MKIESRVGRTRNLGFEGIVNPSKQSEVPMCEYRKAECRQSEDMDILAR
jgi:hypothetical protein